MSDWVTRSHPLTYNESLLDTVKKQIAIILDFDLTEVELKLRYDEEDTIAIKFIVVNHE